MPRNMAAEQLGRRVIEIVANPDAAIAIRSLSSVYLWVNEAWSELSTVSAEKALGKRLHDMSIVPVEQADRFLAEDLTTLEKLRLITINTYHVGPTGVPIRFMTIRVAPRFKGKRYIIEVSFILGPLITSQVLNWSSERFEYAFGDDLARNIAEGVQG